MTCLRFSASVLIAFCVALGGTGFSAADDKANRTDELRFREKLNAQVELSASRESVRSVLEELLTAHGLPVEFDEVALADANNPLAEEIDLAVQGITLRSVLSHLLVCRDLAWEARDGQFRITTRDRAFGEMVVRCYPTRSVAKTDDELRELAAILVRVAAPESWEDLGGTGSLRAFRGGLLVRQSTKVHAEIAKILRGLAGDGEEESNDRPETDGREIDVTEETEIVSEEKILSTLREPVDVDFQQLDFEGCLEQLRALSPVTIWCDPERLKRDGAAILRERTLSLKRATLESVLNHVLSDTGVAWSIADEGILLSLEGSRVENSVRLYAVKDLPDDLVWKHTDAYSQDNPVEGEALGGFGGSWGGMGGGGGGSGGFFQFGGGGVATMGGGAAEKGAQPADGLAGLLQEIVSPESWPRLGGDGVVVRFRDQLIVRQTAANHQKIASVLADLRKFATASESVPDEAGEPEQTKLKSTYYRIQGDSPETIRHLLLSLEDSAQENVAGSTPTTDSATGKIVATRDGLVIRQTAAGHQRIQRWLKRMVLLDQVIELDGDDSE